MIRVSAVELAKKLQAIRNLQIPDLAEEFQEQPRLLEALWFLQAMSMKPGGLQLFGEKLIEASSRRFQAATTFGMTENRLRHSKEECMSEARRQLGSYLCELCVTPAKRFVAPWYFRELMPSLFDAMDAHKAEVLSQTASTETLRRAFHWLEFARQMKVPVPIIGPSRFGKTTAINTWCESRPGLARIVTVPQSNTERDLILAFADAFGIEHTHATQTVRVAEQVQLVLQESGLFIVLDESHFLLPISYNKATPPRRLNWVRCQLIDKGVNCAFFATPQSYKQTLDRYAKETGYALEQWVGRMAKAVTLPEELGRDDLLAVAKLRFPAIPKEHRELICAAAMASEGYLKNIEHLAKYAQFLAGGAEVALEHVDAAIRHFIPGAAPKPAVKPLQPVCNRIAEPVPSLAGREFDRASLVGSDELVRQL